ncbi:hypothetical protein [Microbulbifer halophilus]
MQRVSVFFRARPVGCAVADNCSMRSLHGRHPWRPRTIGVPVRTAHPTWN